MAHQKTLDLLVMQSKWNTTNENCSFRLRIVIESVPLIIHLFSKQGRRKVDRRQDRANEKSFETVNCRYGHKLQNVVGCTLPTNVERERERERERKEIERKKIVTQKVSVCVCI
jgi:hypothetical protein